MGRTKNGWCECATPCEYDPEYKYHWCYVDDKCASGKPWKGKKWDRCALNPCAKESKAAAEKLFQACAPCMLKDEDGNYHEDCDPGLPVAKIFDDASVSGTCKDYADRVFLPEEEGCECLDEWYYSGTVYKGCDPRSPDASAPWCYVKEPLRCPKAVKSTGGTYGAYLENCDKATVAYESFP